MIKIKNIASKTSLFNAKHASFSSRLKNKYHYSVRNYFGPQSLVYKENASTEKEENVTEIHNLYQYLFFIERTFANKGFSPAVHFKHEHFLLLFQKVFTNNRLNQQKKKTELIKQDFHHTNLTEILLEKAFLLQLFNNKKGTKSIVSKYTEHIFNQSKRMQTLSYQSFQVGQILQSNGQTNSTPSNLKQESLNFQLWRNLFYKVLPTTNLRPRLLSVSSLLGMKQLTTNQYLLNQCLNHNSIDFSRQYLVKHDIYSTMNLENIAEQNKKQPSKSKIIHVIQPLVNVGSNHRSQYMMKLLRLTSYINKGYIFKLNIGNWGSELPLSLFYSGQLSNQHSIINLLQQTQYAHLKQDFLLLPSMMEDAEYLIKQRLVKEIVQFEKVKERLRLNKNINRLKTIKDVTINNRPLNQHWTVFNSTKNGSPIQAYRNITGQQLSSEPEIVHEQKIHFSYDDFNQLNQHWTVFNSTKNGSPIQAYRNITEQQLSSEPEIAHGQKIHYSYDDFNQQIINNLHFYKRASRFNDNFQLQPNIFYHTENQKNNQVLKEVFRLKKIAKQTHLDKGIFSAAIVNNFEFSTLKNYPIGKRNKKQLLFDQYLNKIELKNNVALSYADSHMIEQSSLASKNINHLAHHTLRFSLANLNKVMEFITHNRLKKKTSQAVVANLSQLNKKIDQHSTVHTFNTASKQNNLFMQHKKNSIFELKTERKSILENPTTIKHLIHLLQDNNDSTRSYLNNQYEQIVKFALLKFYSLNKKNDNRFVLKGPSFPVDSKEDLRLGRTILSQDKIAKALLMRKENLAGERTEKTRRYIEILYSHNRMNTIHVNDSVYKLTELAKFFQQKAELKKLNFLTANERTYLSVSKRSLHASQAFKLNKNVYRNNKVNATNQVVENNFNSNFLLDGQYLKTDKSKKRLFALKGRNHSRFQQIINKNSQGFNHILFKNSQSQFVFNLASTENKLKTQAITKISNRYQTKLANILKNSYRPNTNQEFYQLSNHQNMLNLFGLAEKSTIRNSNGTKKVLKDWLNNRIEAYIKMVKKVEAVTKKSISYRQFVASQLINNKEEVQKGSTSSSSLEYKKEHGSNTNHSFLKPVQMNHHKPVKDKKQPVKVKKISKQIIENTQARTSSPKNEPTSLNEININQIVERVYEKLNRKVKFEQQRRGY